MSHRIKFNNPFIKVSLNPIKLLPPSQSFPLKLNAQLTWHTEDIPVLVPIIRPMSPRTVANTKPGRLLANLRVLPLVLVHLGAVLLALLLQLVRQLSHGEPRLAADQVLLQCIVDKLVLFHVFNKALTRLPQLLQVPEQVERLLLLGQL